MLFLCPNFHTSHISPVQRSFLGCLLHGFNGGPPEIWPGIFCRPLDPAGWYAHTHVYVRVLSADTFSVTQNGASVFRTQSSGNRFHGGRLSGSAVGPEISSSEVLVVDWEDLGTLC